MNSKNLIESLHSAMVAERTLAIAIENMIGTFAWSGLPEDARRQVAEDLTRLSTGSRQRAGQLKKLMEVL